MDPFAQPRREELDPVVVALDVIETAAAPPTLPVVRVFVTAVVGLSILLRGKLTCRGREPGLDCLETCRQWVR